MHQADVCNPRFKEEHPCCPAVSLRSGLLPRATNRALHFTRSASPSVVPPHQALSARMRRSCRRALFRAPCGLPPARLWHPCRVPSAAAFELTLVLPLAKGLGRVHRVSVKEPQLVRPEIPSIVEKPFSGSASVPRLCRRGPLPGIPSLVAVARFELAVRPPARPRPGLRLNGRCHSPTSAIAKSTSTPANDPSLHRTEPVTGSFRCTPRVAPRSARRRRSKRNRSSAGAEAPLRRPRTRGVSVRAAADRPAQRASNTSWSPPCPTRGAGDAGMRVAAV